MVIYYFLVSSWLPNIICLQSGPYMAIYLHCGSSWIKSATEKTACCSANCQSNRFHIYYVMISGDLYCFYIWFVKKENEHQNILFDLWFHTTLLLPKLHMLLGKGNCVSKKQQPLVELIVMTFIPDVMIMLILTRIRKDRISFSYRTALNQYIIIAGFNRIDIHFWELFQKSFNLLINLQRYKTQNKML